MTEEMKPDTAQESLSNVAENKPESPSNDGLLSEVMAKKATIKEQAEEIAQLKAANEKRRTKKLEEDGKLNELITELKSSNEKLMSENEKAVKIIEQQKVDIINSITSDDAKREELATKDIETLRFIKNEIGRRLANNPSESIGAVRGQKKADYDIATMTEQEKRDNWPDVVKTFMDKGIVNKT